MASGKRTQLELEDQILELLSSASGSLLDNIELIKALDQSKTTYEEVNEALKVSCDLFSCWYVHKTEFFRLLKQQQLKSTQPLESMNLVLLAQLFCSSF